MTVVVEIADINSEIADISSNVSALDETVVDLSANMTSLTDQVDADTAEVQELQQNFTQLNATVFDLSANATDYERRISTLEDEEAANSGAIADNAREIDANTANIALLNATIHDGTISNLTDQVNSNTAAIANLAGTELLEDHFFVNQDEFKYDRGYTGMGSFTVPAG